MIIFSPRLENNQFSQPRWIFSIYANTLYVFSISLKELSMNPVAMTFMTPRKISDRSGISIHNPMANSHRTTGCGAENHIVESVPFLENFNTPNN